MRTFERDFKPEDRAPADRYSTDLTINPGGTVERAETTDWPPGDSEPLAPLLDEIQAHYERYVVFGNPWQAPALALWTLYTHCRPENQPYKHCPYVLITSAEPMSGKSTILELAAELVHEPFKVQDVTPAVLGRTVAGKTLLLDEIDGIYSGRDEGEETKAGAIKTILNAGFEKGGTYTRSVKTKTDYEVKKWSVFGPKMLAGIGRKVPDTVQTRSIRMRLVRKPADSPAEKARSRYVSAIAEPLKTRTQITAALIGEMDFVSKENTPQPLGHRDQDAWEPLLYLADKAGGEWPETARAAAVELCYAEPVMSLGMQLLRDIRQLFEMTTATFISTHDLIGTKEDLFHGLRPTGLCSFEDSPWATFNRGFPISAKKLSDFLTEYDIKSSRISVTGGSHGPKGYAKADFEKVWNIYLNADNGDSLATVDSVVPTINRDSLWEGETQ